MEKLAGCSIGTESNTREQQGIKFYYKPGEMLHSSLVVEYFGLLVFSRIICEFSLSSFEFSWIAQ
jgi:hypothetical protein